MRKPIQIALGAAVVLLLGTTIAFYQKYHQSTLSYADLQSTDAATRNRYGAAINDIAAIQDSLNAIVMGDSAMRALPSQLDAERHLTETQGDEALAKIALLKAGIERTKDKIEELDARLHKSGVKIAGLQKMIANLKQDVAEKELLVSSLTDRVATLETQVTGLTAAVQADEDTINVKQETIETKSRELSTIYYTIGTKHDLAAAGVIVAKGGVLGLGKTVKPTGQVVEANFTPLDTDQEDVIHIPAAKAQVLSAQPPTSYQLQTVDGKLELHIVDRGEFRKIKHLVIMTA